MMSGEFETAVAIEGRALGVAARVAAAEKLRSCPEWTGADLLAHTTGFARLIRDLLAGTARAEVPPVSPEEALRTWDDDLDALVQALRDTDPETPAPNWSSTPDTAAFWLRRAAHELAVHRWDAQTGLPGEPEPIETALARDGIAEFLDVFVATGLAAGMAPPTPTTLAVEITDTGERLTRDLPDPGPVTTMRGTASDLVLAMWRRRDPVSLHAGGDRAVLEQWPSI
jgi:uncharacterized protein (TIGR03083 family)